MAEIQTNPKGFFVRLKQHHIYRVAVGYGTLIAVLIQVVARAFPYFGWSAAVPAAIIVLIAGFPVVLVLAWLLVKPTDTASQTLWQRRHWKLGAVITPVVIAAVVVSGIYAFRFSERHAARMAVEQTEAKPAAPAVTVTIPAKSIAVLPFENLSTDKANAYFADGMQDLILTKLADIGDLKVISRTSTEMYKSHPEDLKTIAIQLGVAAILEGSVQKAGNQVLINVQLIDANSDAHIWAQSYQRTLDNIFGVEGEVAQKIAAALQAKLSPTESARVADVPTTNAAAYDAYLRGLVIEKNPSPGKGALRQAEALYAEAVKLDPQFALAWAHLAYMKILIYSNFIDRSPAVLADAKQDVDKALQLQPDLGQGYLVLAKYYYLGLRDLDDSVPPLMQAQKLLPNSADVLVGLSDVEERQGKWQEANVHLRQASLLEPRSVEWLWDLADNYAGMREFPQARVMLDRALVLSPDNPGLIMDKANTWQEQGNLGEAQQLIDRVPVSDDSTYTIFTRWQQFMEKRDYPAAIVALESFIAKPANSALTRAIGQSFLARALDMAGRKDEARALASQVIGELESQRKSPADDVLLAQFIAQTYAILGDKAAALREAQRDVVVHSTCSVCKPYHMSQLAQLQARFGDADPAIAVLPYLLTVPTGLTVSDLRLDPGWDPLRKDPRFQTLLKKYAKDQPATAATAAPTAATSGAGP
ncbi:MAG: hypothetical protein WCC11_10825 [Gammaproteobacteria bacterium]